MQSGHLCGIPEDDVLCFWPEVLVDSHETQVCSVSHSAGCFMTFPNAALSPGPVPLPPGNSISVGLWGISCPWETTVLAWLLFKLPGSGRPPHPCLPKTGFTLKLA